MTSLYFLPRFLTLLTLFTISTAARSVSSSSDSSLQIAKIIVTGNAKTDEDIILREITFKSGDLVSDLNKHLERSEANLINTELFNYVKISALPVAGGYADVLIEVHERWYLWPFPIFKLAETNFNTWWLRRDFRRANYGLMVVKRNFRGRNEDLVVRGQVGYSKEFVVMYKRPYLHKNKKLGFSFSAGYVQLGEITVGTEKNKRIFFRSGHGRTREDLYARAAVTLRNRFYWSHYFELNYQNQHVVDTLTHFTNDYFFANAAHTEYPGFVYNVRYDMRDNKGYPLVGWLVHAEVQKYGIALTGDKNLNVAYTSAYVRNYNQMADRLYYAWQLKYRRKLSADLPYYFQRALGYDDFVRGFEYYVIDGQHFGLLKTNLKLNIFRPHIYPIEKLRGSSLHRFRLASYVNLYVDAGYVWDKRYNEKNALANEILYSFGAGIDLLAYYDKVVRVEYSFNSLMQHGLFLHFVQPI